MSFPRRMALACALTLAFALPNACAPTPPAAAVQRFETGDYQVEFDGQQKRVTIGVGLMRMVRHPEDIVIADGTLRVGGRDYGPVARKDTIAVVAGKVAVNGRERQPSLPEGDERQPTTP